MPSYHYRCDCGDFLLWQPLAAEPLASHEGCAGRPLRVLGPVRTHGVGPRGAKTREVDRTERTWDRDRPAYKRLRHEGHQPPHVDGAADLETRAENEFDIRTGLKYGHLPAERVKEGIGQAREAGWLPTKEAV